MSSTAGPVPLADALAAYDRNVSGQAAFLAGRRLADAVRAHLADVDGSSYGGVLVHLDTPAGWPASRARLQCGYAGDTRVLLRVRVPHRPPALPEADLPVGPVPEMRGAVVPAVEPARIGVPVPPRQFRRGTQVSLANP